MKNVRVASLALFLASVFFLSPALSLFAEETRTYSPWAEEYIKKGFQEEIVIANKDRAVFEDWTKPCSRALFSSFAVRLYEKKFGSLEAPMTNPFGDTEEIDVIKAHHLGIIKGRSPKNFDPDASITREEAAIMMSRLALIMGLLPTDKPRYFNDIEGLSLESQEAITSLSSILDTKYKGLIRGIAHNVFGPKLNYTREQAIATMMRLSEVYDDNKNRSRIVFELEPSRMPVPKAARDYAYDYTLQEIKYYEEKLGFQIKEAKITKLMMQNTGTAAENWSVNMYLLEYRLLPEQSESLKKLVDTRAVDGYITESKNGNQPYLILLISDKPGERKWERVGMVMTDKIKSQYSTKEMLEEYGNNPLTAATMEIYKQYMKLKEKK